MSIPKNILVIVAHPDDEAYGMGGTIKKLSENGDNVYVVYVTDGYSSRGSEGVDRTVETINAGRTLGVFCQKFMHLKDQELDTYDKLYITKLIEYEIRDINPDIVYTHAKEDVNSDHRIVHDCVMVACRPKPYSGVLSLFTFEVCGSEWGFDEWGSFTANTFVDVEGQIDSKYEAISKYESELMNEPHPRSLEIQKCKDIVVGSKVGLICAESFKQVYTII